MEDGMKQTSITERVSGTLVTLVNPRFMYFNRPLCLAITVAVLAFLGFWPLFGYYAWTTTTVVTDNSQTDMTVISGPLTELDTVIMEYSRLPPRCTGLDGHHYFSGTREEISSDGLTETQRVCDYDVCILSTYEYVVQADYGENLSWAQTSIHVPEEHSHGVKDYDGNYVGQTDSSYIGAHSHEVNVPPSYKQMTQMCMIQDEWLEGLVKQDNPFLFWFQESGTLSNFSCGKGSDGQWCPFEKELEANRFMSGCCVALKTLGPNQLPFECSVLNIEFNNTNGRLVKVSDDFCSPMILDWFEYVEALKNRTNHAFYKICPQEAWKYENPAFKGNMPNCNINGAWSLEPFSFKLLWTRSEVVTTTTRIAVTLLIIVIFRWLGIVKETKEFTWGEIINEAQSAKSAEKDMQDRIESNIRTNFKADPDLRGAAVSESPASPSSPSTTIKVAKVTAKVKPVKVEPEETSLPHAPQRP